MSILLNVYFIRFPSCFVSATVLKKSSKLKRRRNQCCISVYGMHRFFAFTRRYSHDAPFPIDPLVTRRIFLSPFSPSSRRVFMCFRTRVRYPHYFPVSLFLDERVSAFPCNYLRLKSVM